MKILLFFLTVLNVLLINAGEQIFLNPSSPVGIFHRKNGMWQSAASRLELGYSAKGLVLDAVLTVPPGKKFKAAGKTGNEISVFGGEVFEFQIAPAGQNGVYYHFAVSPSGFMYTARCRDMKWNPAGTVLENRVSGTEWHFRLTVPFRDLDAAPPQRGEVWRINLARSDVSSGEGRINSSHSGAADFHDLTQYSEVIFGKDAPADSSILLTNIQPKDNLLQLDFTSRLRNEIPLRIEFYTEGRLCSSQDAVMRKGSLSVQVPFPFRKMPLKIGIPAHMVLKNAGSGKILCRNFGILSAPAEQLRLDRFYYTPSDSKICFRHDLSGTVSVRLYDDTGKQVRTVTSGNFIALSGLQPGRYVLEASNNQIAVSRILFLLERPLALGPLPAGQSLTVSGGQLCYGGKPVFLLGLSTTPKSFLQFSDAFNLSFNRAGVRKNSVILGSLPGGKLIRKPFVGRIFPPDNEYFESLSAWSRKATPGKNRILWRISYEAQIPKAVKNSEGTFVPEHTGDFMFKSYQTVKKADPSRIYSIQTDRADRIRDLSRACDVFEVALSSSYAEDMIPNLQQNMLRVKKEAAPGKPVIFWLGGTIPNRYCRLAEEIRMAVYLSVLHGFSGNIIHMGHGFLPPERSRLWSLLSGIHAEIESFYGEWVSGKEIPVKIPAPFIGKAVKTPSGNTLLMVINPTPGELILPSILTGVPKNDLFTGYEPKLYRLSGLLDVPK